MNEGKLMKRTPQELVAILNGLDTSHVPAWATFESWPECDVAATHAADTARDGSVCVLKDGTRFDCAGFLGGYRWAFTATATTLPWFQWPNDLAETEWADYPGQAKETKTHWLEVQPVDDTDYTGTWSWRVYAIDGDYRPLIDRGEAQDRDEAIALAERAAELPVLFTRYYIRLSTGAEINEHRSFAYYLTAATFQDGEMVDGDSTLAVLSEQADNPADLHLGLAELAASEQVANGRRIEWTPWLGPKDIDEFGGFTAAVGTVIW